MESDEAWGDESTADRGPPPDDPTAVDPPATGPPRRIGAYHIKSVIASGGMGTVYVALQEQPRRTVALKVMKAGIASRSALRRFEYESQILARLRHPNIAQVYEAGTHDDGSGGVPYFAMEYVPGAMPLTEYAVAKKLGTRERLDLFAKVCDAVHHGHQKGIIHRDLKPSNILVDSAGEPKIIDFGVARATDSDLAVTTLQTDIGQLIGTVQYMSPEQFAADPHDLDTRSDVYALGVVLFELLCQQLPYDLAQVAIHEAARVVREDEPARPSTINRTLRGDVETITLKALEKDRDRRYRSAADLQDDIRRYLADEPIAARPVSFTYQLRKLASRNRAVFISAALSAVALLVATALSLFWAIRADQQRTLALAASVEANVQRDRANGNAVAYLATGTLVLEKAMELDSASQRARAIGPLATQVFEELEGITHATISDLSDEELRQGLESLREQVGDAMPRVRHGFQMLDELASAKKQMCERLGEHAWQVALSRQSGHDQYVLANRLAALAVSIDAEDAEARQLQMLCQYRLGAFRASLFELMGLISSDSVFEQFEAEHFDLDEKLVIDPHAIHVQDQPIRQLIAALCLLRLGDYGGCETVLDRLKPRETEVRSDPRAHLLYEELLAELVEPRQHSLGLNDDRTLASMRALAAMSHRQGDLRQAEQQYREALRIATGAHDPDHPHLIELSDGLARVLTLQERFDEAERVLRQGIATESESASSSEAATLRRFTLGGVLFKQDKLEDAEQVFRTLFETEQARYAENRVLPEIYSSLGATLAAQGRLEDAEVVLLKGFGELSTIEAPKEARRDIAERLARVYEGLEQPDQALIWSRRADSE